MEYNPWLLPGKEGLVVNIKEVKTMLDRGEFTPDELHHQLDVTTLPPPPKRGKAITPG